MSHPVDAHVGHKLRQLRKARNLSQTDLGRDLGISFQQIQKYEAGSNRISASRLFELAQALNVSPDYFFAGIHDRKGPKGDVSPDAALAAALSNIRDDETKKRILSFIEGVSVAKREAGE